MSVILLLLFLMKCNEGLSVKMLSSICSIYAYYKHMAITNT